MSADRFDDAELGARLRSAPVGVVVVDANKRYVWINERFAALNGVPSADHIGRTPREVIPKVGEAAESVIDHVLQTKLALTDLEMEPLSSEGLDEGARVRLNLYPLEEDGHATGVLGIATITRADTDT